MEGPGGGRHFVLGGLAVFERVTYFLSRDFESLVRQHLEEALQHFPAEEVRAGRGKWRRVPRDRRDELVRRTAELLRSSNRPGVALLAVAAEKTDQRQGESLIRDMVEQICLRFDEFLVRLHRDGDTQRGLVILSEGRFHGRARVWVREFRELGTKWGNLRNFCDIAYFAQARETRLLQLADFVAHAVWRFYEHGDRSLFWPLVERFDQSCDCPACASRRRQAGEGQTTL